MFEADAVVPAFFTDDEPHLRAFIYKVSGERCSERHTSLKARGEISIPALLFRIESDSHTLLILSRKLSHD